MGVFPEADRAARLKQSSRRPPTIAHQSCLLAEHLKQLLDVQWGARTALDGPITRAASRGRSVKWGRPRGTVGEPHSSSLEERGSPGRRAAGYHQRLGGTS
ncbi:hypothetical protein NDU88_006244 [Pleurodeles waltl]|uniref:Uncharacterized protein n=1 Tax=Pleurodeles waltl TaxID=8319 RepID=A0AAV7TF20_PLEWA|nr:hypothetical protein NDU88_006244 [Pleurodeles waltl]